MQSKHFEPKIILKTYDLYLNFYLEIKKWPKPERYNLGKRGEDLILIILEKMFFASRTNKKRKILFATNIKLQILKFLIRLGRDAGVITDRKYLFLQKQLFEIGGMLGSWIKKV